jgi:hypothetical protein
MKDANTIKKNEMERASTLEIQAAKQYHHRQSRTFKLFPVHTVVSKLRKGAFQCDDAEQLKLGTPKGINRRIFTSFNVSNNSSLPNCK